MSDMTSGRKKICIISGGTTFPIAPHLSLCAPAYGRTGRYLAQLCAEQMPELAMRLYLTKMAGGDVIENRQQLDTNQDVDQLVGAIIADYSVKIVFMPVALCDFNVTDIWSHRIDPERGVVHSHENPGKDHPRLISSQYQPIHGDPPEPCLHLALVPAAKIIKKIRATRKDIFLVGFKTTDGADVKAQYIAGLNLLKEASCNLVLANDVKTRLNMVITPEEAKYHVTSDRNEALRQLVEMAYLRSHLTFTRSTVVAGEPVPWASELVPQALRTVVNYCIERNAYKPFRGATVGHFAVKLSDKVFLTSRRKQNFNELDKIGLVRIDTDGPDSVIAYGSKPSVGGQSQRIVFAEHPEYDCIVHAHVPMKPGREFAVPTVSQREYECGSHECGRNTSRGLRHYGNGIAAVYLDQHGPNIVFSSKIDPQKVIDFIELNFNLQGKTGGYVS